MCAGCSASDASAVFEAVEEIIKDELRHAFMRFLHSRGFIEMVQHVERKEKIEFFKENKPQVFCFNRAFLEDEQNTACFRKFMERERNEENIDFYMDVDKLKGKTQADALVERQQLMRRLCRA